MEEYVGLWLNKAMGESGGALYFLGVSGRLWIFALLAFVAVLVAYEVFKRQILHRLEKLASKTNTFWDDILIEVIKRTSLFFVMIVALFMAILVITIPTATPIALQVKNIATKFTMAVTVIQAAIWLNTGLSLWMRQITSGQIIKDGSQAHSLLALGFLFRLILWVVIILLLLSNLGFNISALITGLGIGGVAVALAVQNILGDVFASMSILFDKPFVVGDFIQVDSFLGRVEHIGLKTTRLRSLSGEQVVMSNNDLLKSRIINMQNRQERRVLFCVDVVYNTSLEHAREIPEILKAIVQKQELVRFERAHLKALSNSSLIFEVVYYVTIPDYIVYMDIQQRINLEILEIFRQKGIQFAYPTQTVYVHHSEVV